MTIWFRFAYPFLLVLLFSFSACMTFTHCSDDKPTQPPDTLKSPDTTSHQLVWVVDTIPAINFEANKFIGFDINKIYLIGYSSGMDDACWRWDGKKWNIYSIAYGFRDIYDVDALDSSYMAFTGPNDGPTSTIKIIDNGALVKIKPPANIGFTTCIDVYSRGEILLGSMNGFCRYFNEEWEWLLDTTDQYVPASGVEFAAMDIRKFNDSVVEFTSQKNTESGTTVYYRWQYNSGRCSIADSFYSNEQEKANIRFGYRTQFENGRFVSCSKGGIYEFQELSWRRIHEQGGTRVCGTTNNILMTNGKDLRHYNGSTWSDIKSSIVTQYPNLSIDVVYAVYCIDHVFFVCVRSASKTLVLKGQ